MSAFTVRCKAGLRKERKAKEAQKELPTPPSRIARMLALAHLIARLVEQGKIKNQAETARRLRITRARLSQIANLINLPSETQNAILLGQIRTAERDLRSTAADIIWP